MNLDKTVGERTVYGILDVLGDVGGFNDALKHIVYVILFFL